MTKHRMHPMLSKFPKSIQRYFIPIVALLVLGSLFLGATVGLLKQSQKIEQQRSRY